MKKNLFLISLFSCSSFLFAQDKIVLENSREITNIKVTEVTTNSVKYKKFGNPDAKEKGIYSERVFSVSYSDGTEKVIYAPDPAEPEFSVEQMRMFIKGTQDSRKVYHNELSYIVGFLFGVAGPFAANLSLPPFIALPPGLGIFLVSIGSPNMNHQNVDRKYLNNEEYLMGYQRKARLKKARNAFYSSLIGVGAGLIIVNNIHFK